MRYGTLNAALTFTAVASFTFVIARSFALWRDFQDAGEPLRDGGFGSVTDFFSTVTVETVIAPVSSFLLSAASTVTGNLTRGLRNNNPGNIRRTGTKWEGMAVEQTDPSYITFVSMEYGIRAIARTLNTYHTRYGINTVRGYISRWAPPSENNTRAYIAAVSNYLGVGPDEPFDLATYMPDLIKAICRQENSYVPLSETQIAQGISLAGISYA